MAKRRLRDVVVVLPGITGSVLQKDGRDVWAVSGQAARRAVTTFGGSLEDLALQDDDPDADDLGDGVRATSVVPDAHLVPGLVKIDGYTALTRLVTDAFSVETTAGRPSNFVEFPYDWRRDNRAAARALKRLVDDHLAKWRQHSGAADARVILLGHSMGGLVARYYLEVLEGWRDCRALVTFGTPYRGSVNALGFLANGYKKFFLDLTDMMRSLTSVHQLLPIYAVLRTAQGLGRVAETADVPGVVPARAEAALRFHREIEAAVERHRDDAEYRERGYTLLPVVGTRQPTMQSAVLADGRVSVGRTLPEGIDEALEDGDGTVPRLSAIPIELSADYRNTFVPERHASLQCNGAVLADLRGRLEQMQVTGLEAIRGPEVDHRAAERTAVALDFDDAYAAEEPVEIRAGLVNLAPDACPLEARVAAVDAPGVEPTRAPMVLEGEQWVSRPADLVPGLYRVEVGPVTAGPGRPPPVRDLFEVVG